MLLLWSVGSSLAVCPHSLSYFNELAAVLPTPADASYPTPIDKGNERLNLFWATIDAGVLNGPRHLLGSNLDWGQDIYYLEDWCESHPEAQPIKIACYGDYPLRNTQIKLDGAPPIGPTKESMTNQADTETFGPLPGWYAVSVNEIYGQSQQYRYFLHFKPAAMAGYSIYIYHITVEEANRVRQKLGLAKLDD
jgi:hypothetical protein